MSVVHPMLVVVQCEPGEGVGDGVGEGVFEIECTACTDGGNGRKIWP